MFESLLLAYIRLRKLALSVPLSRPLSRDIETPGDSSRMKSSPPRRPPPKPPPPMPPKPPMPELPALSVQVRLAFSVGLTTVVCAATLPAPSIIASASSDGAGSRPPSGRLRRTRFSAISVTISITVAGTSGATCSAPSGQASTFPAPAAPTLGGALSLDHDDDLAHGWRARARSSPAAAAVEHDDGRGSAWRSQLVHAVRRQQLGGARMRRRAGWTADVARSIVAESSTSPVSTSISPRREPGRGGAGPTAHVGIDEQHGVIEPIAMLTAG